MSQVNTAVTTAFLTYSAITSIWWSLSGRLSHDEHQFIASAFMVAQYGLHPYQDFAYFHMPNLVYLYAPFFFLPYPFMVARLFVGICGFGLCLMIFLYARSLLATHSKLISLIVPICITALLIHSHLFVHVLSNALNHIPSTLFVVLAFLLHCRAIHSKKPSTYFFLSGMSLGMAIGIRLTFAPLIIPFLFAIAAFSVGAFKTKGLQALVFTAGGLFANFPAVFFFLTSFQDFWFGNLGYPELNTTYREAMSYSRAMGLMAKIKYLFKDVFAQPAELLVLLGTLYSLLLFAVDRLRNPERPRFELVFLLLSLPFLFLGSIAPTPSWHQYYFALIPFLVLFMVYVLSSLRGTAFLEAAGLFFVVSAALSFVHGSPFVKSSTIAAFTRPELLTPIQLHRDAEVIKGYVDARGRNGRVLTLSPLYLVEAQLPIYEEFVTGPFAWRVSHLLSEEEAIARRLPLQSRITSFLEEKRPDAILTGKEHEQLEIPITRAAHELRYQPMAIPSGLVIWLSSE